MKVYFIVRLLFLLFMFPLFASAQKTDIEFVVQKIKNNYPNYNEKTKGADFDKFVKKTTLANKNDSFKMMSKIVDFFHDRHLDLFRERDLSINANSCRSNLQYVLNYFSNSKVFKRYEGFWISEFNHCILAIKQTKEKPLKLNAYVIECRDSSIVPPGTMFYNFEQLKGREFYTRAMNTSKAFPVNFYVHSLFRNDSTMTAGPYNKWHKLRNYHAPMLPKLPLLPDSTTGRWLDSSTFLITIPGSSEYNGMLADSIIKANPQIKTRANNLIVDIRNNTGGRVIAYRPLYPLLYTKPILKINAYDYCTPDNINHTKDQIAGYIKAGVKDSSVLKELKEWSEIQQQNVGKFLLAPQDTLKLDTIYEYPKHVSFIINYGCQSAAEMVLLEAKQSSKVMIFGEHSMGAVDNLDYYAHTSPSGKYMLFIPTARRFIPAGQKKLDGIGIQPDVFIDDSNDGWVDFVKRYYEKY